MADSRDKPEQSNQTHCSNCGQDWKTHDYSCVDNKAGQPNQNLMIIIEEIEGLMSQVNEKLNKIDVLLSQAQQSNAYTILSQSREEIDLFQKTTLFELRRAFE